MRSTLVCVSLVAVLGPVGLVACGADVEPGPAAAVEVGVTNYVTVAAAPVTFAPSTTAPDAPGSIMAYESEYSILAGDLPVTISQKFGVAFADLMTLNEWILEGQFVTNFPPVGSIIKIPAGATVPGEPVDPGPLPVPGADTTGPPATDPPVRTTTTAEPPGETCGDYVIVENDTPGVVATKLNTTVAKLAAANTTTKGYKGFILGITIKVPC